MDMMELRFRMMAAMGGSGMVGRFSQCRTVQYTPASSDQLVLENPFGDSLKMIVVTCGSSSTPKTSNGYIQFGIWWFGDNHAGVAQYLNISSVITSASYSWQSAASNTAFRYNYDGDIVIRRVSVSGLWATDTAYDVEFYA